MSIGRTNAAGGSGPDFRVTSGAALPASGSEKDVFIISDVAVKTFAIVNYYPGFAAASGYTVLHTSDISGAVGVAWPRFNVFRPSGKILSCSLDGCRQYSNGAWQTREAYQFRNGKWVQFAFLNIIPEFTYTGRYETVDDNDKPITESTGNWKIRFLTSGTLKFADLRSAANGIDVFLVGGGGNGGPENGAGGGGYTKTVKNIAVNTSSSYPIIVGAGVGDTSAFGTTAKHGITPSSDEGGDGGSGGGGSHTGSGSGGNGGTDGANGQAGGYAGGKGQGSTTREFGESTGKRYAGGGGAAGSTDNGGLGGAAGGEVGGIAGGSSTEWGGNAAANTGGGGGASRNSSYVGKGGSGIVIIRNKR